MENEVEGKGKAQRGIRSLETGGAILKAMAEALEPIKLRDLAEATDIAPAQLHPYLVSFRTIGMVEQTESGRYRLGPFALELGLSRLRAQDAYHEAILRAGALAEETRLMVALSVWGLHGVTIVHVRDSPARIHANVRAGGGFALTNTATGRLFVAHLPADLTEPLIARELTERASAERGFDFDMAAYRDNIARVKTLGFATTTGVPIPGLSAISVPVFDYSSDLKLAVTVIGPSAITDLSEDGPLLRSALDFTRRLSADLGYRPR